MQNAGYSEARVTITISKITEFGSCSTNAGSLSSGGVPSHRVKVLMNKAPPMHSKVQLADDVKQKLHDILVAGGHRLWFF